MLKDDVSTQNSTPNQDEKLEQEDHHATPLGLKDSVDEKEKQDQLCGYALVGY